MAVVNSCSCKPPVGGGGSCAPHQLAICRNDGLHCHHECRDSTPVAALSDEEFQKWAFGEITGQVMTRPLTSTEQAILASGIYRDPLTGDVITFGLPDREGGAKVQYQVLAH